MSVYQDNRHIYRRHATYPAAEINTKILSPQMFPIALFIPKKNIFSMHILFVSKWIGVYNKFLYF